MQSGVGDGSAHLVITLGPLVEQIAWNKSMSPEGVARSSSYSFGMADNEKVAMLRC